MYLAEIHGKLSRDNENKEDILTSNVFSFFKYADRKVFLFELLSVLGLEISVSDAVNAEFHFWPSYEDKTEPDLVLIVGKYYLLFEAKYHSGFGLKTEQKEHQVVREIVGGKYEAENLGKDFKIIAVTAHYSDKSEIKKDIPPEFAKDLLWINWQRIALLIYQQLENKPDLPSETQLFANDLYELLVLKKLRNFEGLKVFSDLAHALYPNMDNIFFEAKTARYRGAFLGFETALPDTGLASLNSSAIFWKAQEKFFDGFSASGISVSAGNIFFTRKKE